MVRLASIDDVDMVFSEKPKPIQMLLEPYQPRLVLSILHGFEQSVQKFTFAYTVFIKYPVSPHVF